MPGQAALNHAVEDGDSKTGNSSFASLTLLKSNKSDRPCEFEFDDDWDAPCRTRDAIKLSPCNIIPCASNSCKLDLNDVDWSFATIGHRDDPEITWPSQTYIDMGVYYNLQNEHVRRETPHVLTGHFPDGSRVANIRCLRANVGGKYETHLAPGVFTTYSDEPTNYDAEFHSATCNCNQEGDCEWDRMMPTCNEIGNHPGLASENFIHKLYL